MNSEKKISLTGKLHVGDNPNLRQGMEVTQQITQDHPTHMPYQDMPTRTTSCILDLFKSKEQKEQDRKNHEKDVADIMDWNKEAHKQHTEFREQQAKSTSKPTFN